MAHKVLDAVTSTGASTSTFLSEPKSTHTIEGFFTGTVTVLSVALEYSKDGRNVEDSDAKWYKPFEAHRLSAAEITAKEFMCHINTEAPIKRIRTNITVYTGTGPVTIHYIEGRD